MYNEEFVRRAFLDDIKSLSHRAEAEGVTAYLHRPRQALRPNERFLQNTLKGIEYSELLGFINSLLSYKFQPPLNWLFAVLTHQTAIDMIFFLSKKKIKKNSANKRLDEEEMWRRHRLRQERSAQPGDKHYDEEGDERSTSVPGKKYVEASSVDVRITSQAIHTHTRDSQHRTAVKRARGRGSVGPRSDLEGSQDKTRHKESNKVDDTLNLETDDGKFDKIHESHRSSHRHKRKRRDKTRSSRRSRGKNDDGCS